MSAILTPKLLDLRSLQTPTGPKKAGPVVRGALARRDPAIVDALMLHQTACTFGVMPYQVHAAGGDALLAQFLRAKNVHAHITAFDEGTFCPSYPLMAYVWHGNGASRRSIGLEIEGLFNGQPGGLGNALVHGSRNRGEPSDLLVETARAACTWAVEEAAREGATLRYIWAHRQFSASRQSDPGWKLWQAVALDHCEKKLGLQVQIDLVDRNGRPISTSWDSRSAHPY